MTIEVVCYYSSTNNNHGAIEKKIFSPFTHSYVWQALLTNIFYFSFYFQFKGKWVSCLCLLFEKKSIERMKRVAVVAVV